MRLILLAMFLSAAAAADDAKPALPRLSAEAYAEMAERGEQLRKEQLDEAKGDKATTTAQAKARRARLATIEASKGKVIPELDMAATKPGRLVGAYVVDEIDDRTTVIRDLNGAHQRLAIDGVDNGQLADGVGFGAGDTIFQPSGHTTLPDGSTVLHLQAVLPPAAP